MRDTIGMATGTGSGQMDFSGRILTNCHPKPSFYPVREGRNKIRQG